MTPNAAGGVALTTRSQARGAGLSRAGLLGGRIVLAALCGLSSVGRVAAQQDSALLARGSAQRAPGAAPVVMGRDTLMWLYGYLGPFSPAQRAAAAERRLAQLLARHGFAGDTVSVVDAGTRSEIVVGHSVLVAVVDSDAVVAGTPRAALASQYAATLQAALRSATARSSIRAILIDVGLAVLATAVLVGLLMLMAEGYRRLYRRLERARMRRTFSLRIQRFELMSAGRAVDTAITMAKGLRVVLTILLFYVYVPLVLSLFPWTAPIADRIASYAITPFATLARGIVGYLPNLFYIAAIIIVTTYILKFVHFLFRAVESGGITISGFYPDWAEPTYKILRVLVLAFAIVVIFPYLPGANSDALKGISIFLGVLLSFGSSSAIANVIAGVVLIYTRAFQVGDRVQIGDAIGDVVERTLLVTRLRTIKLVEVTIPNSTVLSGHVFNYMARASQPGLILHTTVTIGYDAPWRTVHRLLVEAALQTGHIVPEPAPFVLQTALNDFFVSYEINAHTDAPALMASTYSALHQNIQDRFNAGGVEIMSPHYAALRDGNRNTATAPSGESATPPSAFRVSLVQRPADAGGAAAGTDGRAGADTPAGTGGPAA